jgi:hypothetical protein
MVFPTTRPHPDTPAPLDTHSADAEALIPEARDRQRHRHRRVGLLVGAVMLLSFLGFLVYRSVSTNASGRAGGAGGAAPAGPFAGTWHVHTYYLTIARGGSGTATWPIHVRCGHGPGMGAPPCDRWVPETLVVPGGGVEHVDEIIDGGHATLSLTAVHGNRATARIEGSTVQSTLPDGPVALRVDQVNDLIYLTPSRPTTVSPYGNVPLCGPRIYENIQLQAELHIHCGA